MFLLGPGGPRTLAFFPLPESAASMTMKLHLASGRRYTLAPPGWPFVFPFPERQVIRVPCDWIAIPFPPETSACLCPGSPLSLSA